MHWHVFNIELKHRPRINYAARNENMTKAKTGKHLLDRRGYTLLAVGMVALLLISLYSIGIITVKDFGYEYEVLLALGASFARIWLAFAVILAISVPVSVYLVFMAKHRNAYVTLFQVLASIPATILLPLIVLGLQKSPYHNELVAFVIFVLSGLWYVIFGIMSNRNAIQNSVLEAKEVFGVKGIKAWKSIYLKAIVPGLITGAVTCIGAEWNASIVAEYFKAPVAMNTTTIAGSTAVANSAATLNGTVLTSVKVGMGKFLNVELAAGHYWLMALALINMTVMIVLINRLLWKRAYNSVAKVYK